MKVAYDWVYTRNVSITKNITTFFLHYSQLTIWWAVAKVVKFFVVHSSKGIARNYYLGGQIWSSDLYVGMLQTIDCILWRWKFQPIWMWFKPQSLKTMTIIIRFFVWILYIFRLIWIDYEISMLDFILFVDREFIYLLMWSCITVYLFRLNS